MPNTEDVRAGVIASKIAAHAADIARGLKGVSDRDKKLSIARTNLDWKTHLETSLDPQTARQMHQEACNQTTAMQEPDAEDYCSMCGQQWCSLRTNKEIKATPIVLV